MKPEVVHQHVRRLIDDDAWGAGSAVMICKACGSLNDPKSGICRACEIPLPALAGGMSGDRPPGDDSYGARLAAAEARLAALTQHIATVEAETTAIATSLAAVRRVLAEPAESHNSARLAPAQAPSLDAGTFCLTFADAGGARIEPILPRPVQACAPRITTLADIPSIAVRADAANAVWEAFSSGARAVRLAGQRGAGTSTLLAVLARDARDHGFVDGALYVTNVRGPATDVGQRLAALVQADVRPRYYLPAELRELFTNLRALVLLDRAQINADEQTELGDIFPQLHFVIADPVALPGTPSIVLGPLKPDNALMLVEAGYGQRIGDAERDVAVALAATVAALPGPLRLIGVAARELRRSFVSLHAEFATGDEIVRALIAKLSAAERSVLSILAMAPALLTAERLTRVAGSVQLRASLERLIDCELVRPIDDRYELPGSVESLVPQPAAANVVFERLIDVLRTAFEPRSAVPVLDRELAAAETIVQIALKRSYWASVLALGPRLAQLLALHAAFGAWSRVLNLVTSAAKRVDDAAALNAARHDLGVRCLLLGEHPKALTLLQSAAVERERIGDHAGAAASADVLARLSDLVPVPDLPLARRLPPERNPPLERRLPPERSLPPEPRPPPERSLPPERHPRPRPERHPPSETRVPDAAARRSRRAASLAVRPLRIPRPMLLAGFAVAAVALLAVVFWSRPKAAPAIAEFSTDHASIDGGSSAQLCIKATRATLVAVAPDIGSLPAEGKHCVTVAPTLTTTYTAVATGSAGQEVHGSVTVAVHNAPQRPLQIHAFAALPARVQAGQSTRLCYAVSGADVLRIVPTVGNVVRLRSCQTITLSEPRRYTYDLLAFGENGQVAVRRTHIDVVAASTPAPKPSPAPRRNQTPKVAALPAQTLERAPMPAPLREHHRPPPDGLLARRAVYQFDATPSVVERGQAASLCVGVGRWAQGNVTAIGTLKPGITRCYRVQPSSTTVYRLHVALNKSVADETVTVAVRQPARGHEGLHAQHRF